MRGEVPQLYASHSPGTKTREDGKDGQQYDPRVGPKREVLYVPEIIAELLDGLVHASRVALLHLRPSRDARWNVVAQPVEGNLFFELLHERHLFGPRTDDAHLTL